MSRSSVAQLGRGLQPQLVRQHLARIAVGGERVGLATAAVERQHQLRAQRLAQRMLRHERLQLADQVRMAAEREVGVDARAEADEAQLLEALGRTGRERLVADVLQRRAAPQPERLGQESARRGVLAAC